MKKILLIILFIFICCNDNPFNIDNSLTCENPSWLVDDCGICRECDTNTCEWNGTMDECGECFGDNSSCTGCMDNIAINFDEYALIHDDSCDYNNFININYLLNSSNIEIEPNYKIIRPGRSAYFVNNINDQITINIELANETSILSISPSEWSYMIFEDEGLIEYDIEGYNVSGILLIQNYE